MQSQNDSIRVEAKAFSVFVAPHFGFVIPHRQEMLHLIKGHSKGIEINAEWQTNGSKDWHFDYNFPRFGLDYYYSALGNPEELGDQHSLIFYLKLPLGKGRFKHHFKLGSGAGYSTKIWDLEDNTKSTAISSHFNIALTLQYGMDFRISKKLNVVSGLRINHFSNGAFQTPNLGTNNASIYLGVLYDFNPIVRTSLEKNEHSGSNLSRKIRKPKLSCFIGMGAKELYPPNSKKYSTITLNVLADSRYSSKSSFGLGLDVFSNQALNTLLKDKQEEVTQMDIIQLGALFSYTMHFDQWELKMMLGVYLRDKLKENGTIYNRFGLRYNINEHIALGVFLKTHLTKADHPEIGITWKF